MTSITPHRASFVAEAFLYLDVLVQASLWLTANKPEADALVCEAYAAAYQRWNVTIFEDNCKLSLFRILVRLFFDSRWPCVDQSGDFGSPGDLPAEPYGEVPTVRIIDQLKHLLSDGELEGGVVREAVAHLPLNIRLVVMLSFIAGFSYRDIAEIVDINPDVVRARLNQGRDLMKRDLYSHALRTANRAGDLRVAVRG